MAGHDAVSITASPTSLGAITAEPDCVSRCTKRCIDGRTPHVVRTK